jgi:8-amino-7-oxononanoate synthase
VRSLSEAQRVGECSSRLISGNSQVHFALEEKISQVCNRESSLVYGAGYLSNIGVLSAIASRDDVIFSDRMVHASLIDGILLSRAHNIRFMHNDLNHLEELLRRANETRKVGQRFFIVIETVYSMDGDIAPSEKILELAGQFNAVLIADEAHAFGLFGSQGGGLYCELDNTIEDVVLLGTLSKAAGSYGGFFSGERIVRDYLVNASRSLIFNTALPRSIAQAALSAIELFNYQKAQSLLQRAKAFRKQLNQRGLDTLNSTSHIVPVVVGDSSVAVKLSQLLMEDEIFVPAIRPPTVPIGSSRLRFSLTVAHQKERLEWVSERLALHCKNLGVI